MKLRLPGDAVDGRNQAGEIEIDLCRFHRRFVCFDLRFGGGHRGLGRQIILNRIIKILLAGGLFFG